MTAAVAAALIWAAVLPAARAAPPREVADRDVDRAMAEAKRYLYAQQAPSGLFRHHHHGVPGGGGTAIALFALLEAGESPSAERVKKGLDALAELKTTNLYVIAVRVMVLSQVARNEGYRKHLEEDIGYLTRNALRQGAWGYGGPERTGDNSCSQFALLALWEADRAGVRIDPRLIRQVERTWLRRQKPDGGWTYAGLPGVKTASTLTMTTAALASLYICQDVLASTCAPYTHQSAADKAWSYMTRDLKGTYHRNGYLTFCVQRVGMASGRKFVGDMDWYAAGAAALAEPNPYGRGYGGQWGPVVRAAFELTFLARGRIPLTFNKLAHGEETNWNFHTRDVAHFTEYMRRQFERRMRWQIVRITDNVQRMLDAPILLVTGTDAPGFTDAQWGKLREYCLRGGTLLLVPTHKSESFAAAVKRRLGELFRRQGELAGDHYRLERLGEDHPLYGGYLKVFKGHEAAPAWGVSDGTRLLGVLCERDIACPWQRRATGEIGYRLGVNFFMYATGASRLRTRLRPVFVGAAEREVRHRAKVAWLRHAGNWPSQPFALEYLSRKLTAENRVAIDLAAGAAIDAAGLAGKDLAWMTGSSHFKITDGEVAALRNYLDGGGTLFVNAVGGSREFNDSAGEVIARLLAGRDVKSAHVGVNSPLRTGMCGDFRGPPIKRLLRTRPWQRRSPIAPVSPLRLYHLAGRAAIIHAPYGIHDTLDGHTAHGALSYMPASARDLAANVVLYALSQRNK